MATLSASSSSRRYHEEEQQFYQQDQMAEGSYGDQNETQEATIEGWRDIA
jgi:hypothetical protein